MSRLLPDIGDELLLSVPQTEQVLARVTDAGPGFFDLDLLELPATPQPQLERSALMIEFINDDGIARLHGRLDVPAYRRGAARGHGVTWGQKDTVRFAHRGSPQLLKRREFVRATVDLPLTLEAAGADDEPVSTQAHAIDLSGGGMLVDGLPECPKRDDVLAFALDLGDGEEPVRGRGRVVRLETAKRAGLQFTELAQPDRIRLMHLAFEMSREQRRRFVERAADVTDAPTEVLAPPAGAPAAPTGEGIRLSAHPRARRHIAIAKGWGGLIAFLLVIKLSRGAGLPWPDAIERALVGGIVGYLTLWLIAQTIWRHLALAELEDLRKRLIAKAEEQRAEREREIAEAEAAAQAQADAQMAATPVAQT